MIIFQLLYEKNIKDMTKSHRKYLSYMDYTTKMDHRFKKESNILYAE